MFDFLKPAMEKAFGELEIRPSHLNSEDLTESFDNRFIGIVRSHGDIWKHVSSSPSRKDIIVLCPVSNSIGIDAMPKDYVLSHIVSPGKVPGELLSMNNQVLYLSNSFIYCGRGFPESRKARVLRVCRPTFREWGSEFSFTVYSISSTLIGGMNHSESSEEISSFSMQKYVATLRALPSIEPIFSQVINNANLLKYKHRELALTHVILNEAYAMLVSDIKGLWNDGSNQILNSTLIASSLDGKGRTKSKRQILQILESYVLSIMSEFLLPIVTKRYQDDNDRMVRKIASLIGYSQTDLGIRAEFQAPQSEAVAELVRLVDAHTAADKMIVLKRCVMFIRDAVDGNTRLKFPHAEVDFATDDLVLVIIWVIIRAHALYSHVFADICFCIDFHFNSSSNSEIAFNMCHFEVAVDWFLGAEDGNFKSTIGDAVLQSEAAFSPRAALVGSSITMATNRNIAFVSSASAHVAEVVHSTLPSSSSSARGDLAKEIACVSLSPRVMRQRGRVESVVVDSEWRDSQPVLLIDNERGSTKPQPVRYICASREGHFFGAISEHGKVFTWGRPHEGCLGRGPYCELDTVSSRSHADRPRRIVELGPHVCIVQVSLGRSHALALSADGSVFAWGDNRCGQLGVSHHHHHSRPLPVTNTAATAEMEIGAMGDLALLQACSPLLLVEMSRHKVVGVACGALHSLCVSEKGSVFSWGRAVNGRLGHVADRSNMPEHMIGRPAVVKSNWLVPCHGGDDDGFRSSKIVAVAAGCHYSLARSICGAVFSWGCGSHGSLGHGSHCDEYLPRLVEALHFAGNEIVSVSASHHTLFLSSRGLVFGCGFNDGGQVGCVSEGGAQDGAVLCPLPVVFGSWKASPMDAAPITSNSKEDKLWQLDAIQMISCGEFHSTALTTDGRIVLWGDCHLVREIHRKSATDEAFNVVVTGDDEDTLHRCAREKADLSEFLASFSEEKKSGRAVMVASSGEQVLYSMCPLTLT